MFVDDSTSTNVSRKDDNEYYEAGFPVCADAPKGAENQPKCNADRVKDPPTRLNTHNGDILPRLRAPALGRGFVFED